MKNSSLVLCSFAFALALVGSVRAADIDGKWKAEFETQVGVQKYIFELKADGEKLTGKALGERETDKSETAITEGKIANGAVAFVEPLKFQDTELRIAYQGQLAGDELKLTRKVGDVATETLVAKRVKVVAGIDGKWQAEFDSQIGVQKYLFDLKADGEKLTGKASSERQGQKAEVQIKDGKVANGAVSFVEPLKFQDQEILIEYQGKIVGDELKLHRKVGELAEYDIVAKRVVEKK